MSTKKDLEETLKEIESVGRGETVNGVYVLLDENGVVYADQDGNPVDPLDHYWNNDTAVAERRRSKLLRQQP